MISFNINYFFKVPVPIYEQGQASNFDEAYARIKKGAKEYPGARSVCSFRRFTVCSLFRSISPFSSPHLLLHLT